MVSSRNRKTHAAPARRQGGELRGVLRVFGILLALLPGLAGVLFAEDWPTHRRDLQRSGVSPERLQLPLTQTWAYRSANPPAPAWTGPAKKNYYATNQVLLKSRLAFDRAFHVAVAGDGLYFGSSVDDTVYRLNPANGRRQWAYTTDGPVRFAPTIESGHVYFGSEDGTVYCLRQADGSLRWSYTAAGEDNRLVPSNGRYVSLWPVRSGVLVSGNVAYFSAGFFPGEGVYICAVDAVTGSDRGANRWRRLRRNDVSLQGYALLSASNLYFPAGRSSPYVFNRSSGLLQGRFGGDVMGTFALLAGTTHPRTLRIRFSSLMETPKSPTSRVKTVMKRLPKQWPLNSDSSKRYWSALAISGSTSARANRQLRISPGATMSNSLRSRPELPPLSVTVTTAVIWSV